MTLVDPITPERLHASRALVVEPRASGLFVPRYGGQPEIPLTLSDARLLLRLASAEGLSAADAAEAGVLLDALRARQLVVDAPAAGGGPASSPPGGTEAGAGVASAAPTEGEDLILTTNVLLACGPKGFELVAHDGVVLACLAADELFVALAFGGPLSLSDALAAHREALGPDALEEPAFRAAAARLQQVGLLGTFDPNDPVHARRTVQVERMRDAIRRQALVHREFDRIEEEHDARGGPDGRVRVVGFHDNWAGVPTSLGMIIAAAKAYEDAVLEESYDFRPRLLWDTPRMAADAQATPTIYLFSNYVWSRTENIKHSALVKEISPHHLTVHGGPNTPKYPGDLEEWFAEHPHVDIAVHGEGEITFAEMLKALRGHVGDGPADLSVLADVAGLSYRDPSGAIVQTGSRDRVEDLDTLPSPALTGLFDGYIPAGGGDSGLIIETNRGCPYGCTFCDWGSATLSRIRKFDLDRVLAEIEWCATNKLGIGIADANFGIFERDVAIAEHIARMKATYGFPRAVGNNYAKNTVKHLSRIIEIFTEAGIVAEGKMSMQTFDTETLHTIRRKNIKVEKYHDLSVEFRRNGLPMAVELMLGLPGATPATMSNDLQACIDRDVRVQLFETFVLPNSPMNDPEYREENGIVARQGEMLTQTSTYTKADFDDMHDLRLAFYVAENFGVLRQVATYVRAETRQREIDFYERFLLDVMADQERWPMAALSLRVLPENMVPPVSWARFIDEVRDYLVNQLGIPDDDALDSVLTVQHALHPARARSFPEKYELAHDYEQWHALVADERDQGYHADWPDRVPALRDLPPGSLLVTDPLDTCGEALGFPVNSVFYYENSWDLGSAVCRPRQAKPEPAQVAG